MNTKSIRKEDVEHSWYLLDAEDQILGRFATFVANKLRARINQLLHLTLIMVISLLW